jgi:hypothetical protein
MEAAAGDAMAKLGYERSNPTLAGGDRLAYTLGTVPANGLKMALWRARERWYDITGRAPSSHTMAADSPA